MGLLTFEHSKATYGADFGLYGLAVAALAAWIVAHATAAQALPLAALVGLGLAGWTLLEYLLHRFVLHGLPPFRRWHAEHHARPSALICSPTLLSGTLVLLLVFVPAALLGNWLQACALTLGLLAGYLGYAVTHHALHHWPGDSRWLRRRKRWHGLHHHHRQPGRYGVTTSFWDRVFSTGASSRPITESRLP